MGGSFGRVPDVGWLKSVQTKAMEMGGNWGTLSAAFSGFTSISTIVRGRYVNVAVSKLGHRGMCPRVTRTWSLVLAQTGVPF